MEDKIKSRKRIQKISAIFVVVMFAAMLNIPTVAAPDADIVEYTLGSRITVIDSNGGESDRIFAVSHDPAETELFRIQEDGKVGIGTVSPQNKLDVEGGVVIGATYSGTNTAPTNGLLVEGNVGIGTASPSTKLHVDGDVAFGDGSELTIATGEVTATHSYHTIDVESGITDELVTINGGSVAGEILIIRADNSGRTVVAIDNIGNLRLSGDFAMDDAEDTLTLIFNGSNWLELSRSDNN